MLHYSVSIWKIDTCSFIFSDSSVSNSNIENSSVLDESSTTKSVIQVLKEIARKRCLAVSDLFLTQ